ncbi:MAG: DUF1330 domain-containing protein [Chloroflexi bacterium]|nr:DUF1330 domain-containing protein [Chloroflexota bacterium]
MPAYVIVEVEVHDPVGYDEYKKLAPASIVQYGGKYIARGGKVATLEGDWSPTRLVILEFESVARAQQWIDSPEYAPARKLRHRYASSKMIVVEGLST